MDNCVPIGICLMRSTQIPPAPHEIQSLETEPASGEARTTHRPTITIPFTGRQTLSMDRKLSLPEFLKLLTSNNVPASKAMGVAGKLSGELCHGLSMHASR